MGPSFFFLLSTPSLYNSPPTKASNLRPTPPLWEEDLHSGQRVLYNPLRTNERHVDPRSLYRTVRPQALIFIEPFQHSFTFRFLGNVDPRLGSSTGNLQHSTGSSTGNLQHGSARRFVRVVVSSNRFQIQWHGIRSGGSGWVKNDGVPSAPLRVLHRPPVPGPAPQSGDPASPQFGLDR